MSESSARKLIVSLTSYPARIQFVPVVLEALLAQTRPADEIVLYLSQDQFPAREKDLPAPLLTAAKAGQIEIRWVSGDLKPHKKYLYAFREYPDALIVTVDDDARYPETLLEDLYETHLQYPRAVVAGRTHLITLDAAGQPRPYASWVHRTLGFEEGPSMQLFAVGIGGVLYDPRLFPPELFSEQVIRDTCLEADDLWLKTMELAAGVPVVRSGGSELLRTLPGSQETSLFQQNLGENRNDEILAAVRAWANEYYQKDLFAERLSDDAWPRVRTEEELIAYVNRDKRRLLVAMNQFSTELNQRLKLSGEEAARLKNDLSLLRGSSSYRLGNALLAPLRFLKKKDKEDGRP